MFVKKRVRWALKSKNRIDLRSIARRSKRNCGPPSEIQNESVASKKENGGSILKQTSYGKLFKASITLLEDYCSNSTLHGVNYFVDKERHWLERLWWIAGFVMSIICCGALILKVYDNWNERSIIVSISEELTSTWDIPLPAVTICPDNKIQSKEFNVAQLYKRWAEHSEIVDNMTDEEVKILLAYNFICNPSFNYNNISDKFSADAIIDFVWKLAPSLKYTVPYCRDPIIDVYHSNRHAVCKLEEIMTQFGLCFTFNMLNGKETYSIESTAYSLMDHNKTAQWNLENGYDPNTTSTVYPRRGSGSARQPEFIVSLYLSREHAACSNETGKSFVIALHIPGEIPQWNQFKFRVNTFERASITVEPKVITTSEGLRPYQPDRRKCYFMADRKLRFLKVYTQGNCEIECLSNFTLSLCGCVPHFLLRDANTTICGPAQFGCFDSAQNKLVNGRIKRGLHITEEEKSRLNKLVENCKCWPPCNSIKYDAEIKTESEFIKRNDTTQDSDFFIEFKEHEFMTLTRSEVYGTIDFIANCGGLLGLFVGASFLSVVEMLYYCSLRLYCTRLNRKRENKITILTV